VNQRFWFSSRNLCEEKLKATFLANINVTHNFLGVNHNDFRFAILNLRLSGAG
jgi:hypothetical protein